MSWQSNSSSQKSIIFRLFVASGAVIVIVAVGYALFAFFRKSDPSNGNAVSPKSSQEMERSSERGDDVPEEFSDESEGIGESSVKGIENGKDAEGRMVLTGIASEVFSRKDAPEFKWVTLSVTNEDGSFADYKFVFDKDTKGDAQMVSGGERITVFFFGEPLNEDAVVVGEVRTEKTE